MAQRSVHFGDDDDHAAVPVGGYVPLGAPTPSPRRRLDLDNFAASGAGAGASPPQGVALARNYSATPPEDGGEGGELNRSRERSGRYDQLSEALLPALPPPPTQRRRERSLGTRATQSLKEAMESLDPARRDFAEHFFGSNALHRTATARVLIPAECSAVS